VCLRGVESVISCGPDGSRFEIGAGNGTMHGVVPE
jgi:hypothetical protein